MGCRMSNGTTTNSLFAMYYIELNPQKLFNNSWMQLHEILKFGSFVVLLDPLKNISKSICWNASHNIYSSSYISYEEALEMYALL